jgi:hypothetical protein
MQKCVLSTFLLAATLGSSAAPAATVLGLHEARVIVEHTPTFREAKDRGECPQTVDSAIAGNVATVIIRAGCTGPGVGSGWMGGFDVDLTTGFVSRDHSYPTEFVSPEPGELRAKLFALRAQTAIPTPEIRCLLNRIPLPQVPNPCRRVNITREDDNFVFGTIENSCPNADSGAIHMIVDRYSGDFKTENSGERYGSQELEELRTALADVHSPATLTIDEAKRLVAAEPVIAEIARKGWAKYAKCIVVNAEPVSNADDVWFDLQSGCGESKDTVRLSVNVVDAAITSIVRNMVLNSLAVQQARGRALADARSRRDREAQLVRNRCR